MDESTAVMYSVVAVTHRLPYRGVTRHGSWLEQNELRSGTELGLCFESPLIFTTNSIVFVPQHIHIHIPLIIAGHTTCERMIGTSSACVRVKHAHSWQKSRKRQLPEATYQRLYQGDSPR